MLSLLRKGAPTDLVVRERPPLESGTDGIQPVARDGHEELTEYARLSKSIGLDNPHIDADLGVERFKAFLRKKDWAVFSLPTVIEYMNQKADAESAIKAGWHWRPLRAKDNIRDVNFGSPAYQHQGMIQPKPAFDHYRGPHLDMQMRWSGNGGSNAAPVEMPASGGVYDKLVPLHALRKVSAIESEFVGKAPGNPPVSFFVCDYAPAPHIEYPDPFLMAVVNNARLNEGVGRFVIDFWDEPGFGLSEQLK